MAGWIETVFDAKQVADGGVVRRALEDVEKYVSLDALIREVKMRGFHMVLVGPQVVVLCNDGKMEVIC